MKRRVEDELRDSQERLQQALDAAGMGTFIWRVQTDRGEPDDRMLSLYGVPPGGELNLRVTLGKLIHPDDRQLMADAVAGAIDPRGPGQLQLDFRVVRPSGEVRWINVTGKVFFEGDPPIADRMVGAAMDITERKNVEEALRESEERFRQFGEASSDLLWIRNAESLEFEYVSPAFDQLYGVPRSEVLRRNSLKAWLTLVHPGDRRQAISGLRALRCGSPSNHEYRIVRPDGELRWLHNTDFPIGGHGERVRRIAGIAQDMTERKRAIELQETLLAELQHRVRNILAMMRSMVRRTAASKTDLEEFVRHFERRIESMARTQALLTRAPGRGVDLEDILREEMFAQGAADPKFELAGPTHKPAAHEAEVLTLALHELATNSVKYGALGQDAGSIQVTWDRVRDDGTKWLRLVWDEALGVPINTQPQSGFGTELITRRIPYELRGRSEMLFNRNGLRAVIEFPLGGGESILQTDSVPGKEAAR
jgi:PAS domain S-box-containing protein